MPFVYALCALAALYIIFAVGPAVVAYSLVSGKKSAVPFERMNAGGTYYEPYVASLSENIKYYRTLPSERLTTDSGDGLTLCADLTDCGSDTVVMLVHGFRGDPALNFCTQKRYFTGLGIGTLTVYLRGHSVSGGDSCTLGINERKDLTVWAEYLHRLGKKNIFIYGVSMGASTAAFAAAEYDPSYVRGLILDCGYTDPYTQIGRDCRRRRLPAPLIMPVVNLFFRIRRGVDLRLNTTDALSKTAVPVLFIHDRRDPTVPYGDTEKNFAACASKKGLITVDCGQHTLSFLAGGERVRGAVMDFIKDNSEEKNEKLHNNG